MQRLTTDEKKRLIYLVEQNPILYDTSHEDFSDVKKKDRIWDFIGQSLGIHGELARKIWKNLRDSFRKNIRLYSPEPADIGGDPSSPVTISYKYAHEIQFITPYIKPRGSTIKSSTNSDEGKVDDRPALWDALISDQSDHEDSLIQLAAQKNSPPGHDIRKRKSFMALTNDQDVQTESLEFNNGKMDEINFFEGETEMLKFFESIASLAGRFPSRIRSFLRFKISQLIYETECQINSSDVAIVSNSTKS